MFGRKKAIAMAAIVAALFSTTSHASDCAATLNMETPGFIPNLIACLKTMEKENKALRDAVQKFVTKVPTPAPARPAADIPAGAVIPFAQDCPAGWSIYKPATARFIIGAGNTFHAKHKTWYRQRPGGGVDPIPLTGMQLHANGGEEHHILTIPEIPAHRHGLPFIASPNIALANSGTSNSVPYLDYRKRADIPLKIAISHPTHGVAPAGGNKAHNNMPPYLALYYCKKD